MTAIEVSVIVVSRNTCELLRRCLASVYQDLERTRVSAEVIVVDNGSDDGSPAMVRDMFPAAELIVHTENMGYSAANNRAIARARGRYLLLLNSDTVVRPGAIGEMIRALDADPRLAAAGPRLLNPDGTPQRSCWPFPMKALLGNALGLYRLRLLDDARAGDGRRDRRVDWLSSAAIMIPRRVMDIVGGFDEEFFYSADADWGLRAARAGFRMIILGGAEVVHHGKGSRPPDGPTDPRFAGGAAVHAHFFRKHYGTLGVAVFRLVLLAGSLPRLLVWELLHRLGAGGDTARRRRMLRQLVKAALTWEGTR